jgi:uncharacterized membrane protein YhaH (DUF805 family)
MRCPACGQPTPLHDTRVRGWWALAFGVVALVALIVVLVAAS